MKTYLILAVVAVVLSGCGATIPLEPVIQTQIVDKPIPYCPAPPAVPQIDYYRVDKLTPADINDPGKVGQAYKYDMTFLRNVVRLQQLIIQQYSDTSKNSAATKDEIDKLYQQIQQFSAQPASKK